MRHVLPFPYPCSPDAKFIKGNISQSLLMVGPPGAGKSMLAARLPGILPPLEPAEALGIR